MIGRLTALTLQAVTLLAIPASAQEVPGIDRAAPDGTLILMAAPEGPAPARRLVLSGVSLTIAPAADATPQDLPDIALYLDAGPCGALAAQGDVCALPISDEITDR